MASSTPYFRRVLSKPLNASSASTFTEDERHDTLLIQSHFQKNTYPVNVVAPPRHEGQLRNHQSMYTVCSECSINTRGIVIRNAETTVYLSSSTTGIVFAN